MIQRIWYACVYAYVYVGLRFYFRKIIVNNSDNIPKTGPVLFLANHQNALLDALLVATTHHRLMHFLARADLFKRPFLKWLLSTVNMKPVFRIRDGWASLQSNQESFDYGREVFQKGETLLLFPEGNHDLRRRLRPLSKGFTRIVFDVLTHDPNSPLIIIPVGLNYVKHQAYKTSVSIYYGKPITAKSFFKNDFQLFASTLKEVVSKEMKQIITHIESMKDYNDLIERLNAAEPNYLDPYDTNQKIAALNQFSGSQTPKNTHWLKSISTLLYLINIIPLTFWKKVKLKIKDPVFVATARFATGITVFPLFYLTASFFMTLLAGKVIGALTLLGLLISMPIYGLVKQGDQ